jgi:hypothetical protein
VAARSKAWVCGRSLAQVVGSNSAGGMDVCCECCVLSGRGLCIGLISRTESDGMLCYCLCDREAFIMRTWPNQKFRLDNKPFVVILLKSDLQVSKYQN